MLEVNLAMFSIVIGVWVIVADVAERTFIKSTVVHTRDSSLKS